MKLESFSVISSSVGVSSTGTYYIDYVSSSNISCLMYHPSEITLRIVFNNGTCYKYYGVQKRTYEAIKRADSTGRRFWDLVRFPHRKKGVKPNTFYPYEQEY